MAFNADEHAAALIPPVLIVGGREYRGRILSTEQVAALWGGRGDALAKLKAGEGDSAAALAESRAFMRACVEAWFPAPWYLRWLGINPAYRAFRRLPDATQLQAIESFSLAQRLAAPGAGRAPEPLSDEA